MFQKFNFTKEKINSLIPSVKRYAVLDASTPHLRLMVYPSGLKTYMLCRKVKGKPQRIKIGRYVDLTIEQVRKEAARLNSLIALGIDPLMQKREYKAAVNFYDLFNYYYEHHALLFTKRPLENKRTIERTVYPVFKYMKACDMTSDKMRKFHAHLAEISTKGNANRVIAIVSAVFNFCIKNSFYKGDNPCNKVKKFKTKSRDRFLSREELEIFFEALKQEEALFEHFFLMLLYTGARKSNVLSMKWTDIDFELKQWRLSESETKNKEVNIVYLSDEATSILKLRLQANKNQSNPSSFVFPGEGAVGHLVDPKRAFNRIRKRTRIKNFRMHDLRRTLGSYMAIGGTSLNIIGKALCHKSQVSTAIYARLSQDPVLDAINAAISNIRDSGNVSMFRDNMNLVQASNGGIKFSSLIN